MSYLGPKLFLDTVCIIRLLKQNLFKKILDNYSIFITQGLLNELKSPNSKAYSYMNQLIEEKKISIVDLSSETYQKSIIKLIKRFKGKDQVKPYNEGKRISDLGEIEVISYLLENPDDFLFLTFDNKAKKLISKVNRIKNCLVNLEQINDVLNLEPEEIKKLNP